MKRRFSALSHGTHLAATPQARARTAQDLRAAALKKSAAGVKELVDLMEPKLAEIRAARG